MNKGFGDDPDSWRIAVSAFYLKNTGVYFPSRFPGYPFPEYLNSVLINYGWFATNTLTMIITLISIYAFGKILLELNVKNKGILFLTYAFVPLIWINSTNTMDYMWAMCFIMLSICTLLESRYVLSAALFGLAIGSRSTSLLLLPAILFYIYGQYSHKKIKRFIGEYVVVVGIVSTIVYTPLFLKYGFTFITYYPTNYTLIEHIERFGYNIYDSIGLISISYILFYVVKFKSTFSNEIHSENKQVIFYLIAIVPFLLLYAKVPYDAGYLIPTVPFILLFLEKIGNDKHILILSLLLVSNSIFAIGDIDATNKEEINIKIIGEGLVLDNANDRVTNIEITNEIIDFDMKNSVFIVRSYLPYIEMTYLANSANGTISHSVIDGYYYDESKNRYYVYRLSENQIREYVLKNYTIYYLENCILEDDLDYDLRMYEAKLLEITNE
ncbi:EpsG family protein [Methanolobus sp. WCC4]|uniref:EpsG family protein n=1 Tax=Methanolobus sp. WCC4 TaxID=3125784 RepID=UPI0030F670DF